MASTTLIWVTKKPRATAVTVTEPLTGTTTKYVVPPNLGVIVAGRTRFGDIRAYLVDPGTIRAVHVAAPRISAFDRNHDLCPGGPIRPTQTC